MTQRRVLKVTAGNSILLKVAGQEKQRTDIMETALGGTQINSGGVSFLKFGFAPAVTALGVPWDIWDGPTAVYPWPAAAAVTTIESTSAQDKGTPAVGTGAQTVVVSGLLADYTEVNELVVMDGAAPVTLVNEFLRINRMFVVTAGTSETNVGIITAQHGAVVISNINLDGASGRGQTLQAIYTIPNGFTAASGAVTATILRAQAAFAELAFLVRILIPGATSPAVRTQRIFGLNTQGSSYVDQTRLPSLPSGLGAPAGTDIWVRAQDASATVGISATFTLELVPVTT